MSTEEWKWREKHLRDSRRRKDLSLQHDIQQVGSQVWTGAPIDEFSLVLTQMRLFASFFVCSLAHSPLRTHTHPSH